MARGRVVAFTAVAIALHIAFGDGDEVGFQQVIGFAALPLAIVLAFAADYRRPSHLALAGAALDIAALSAAMLAFPGAAGTMAAAFLLPILIASFTGGVMIGVAATSASLVAMIAIALPGDVDLGTVAMPVVAIGAAVAVSVAAREDTVRSRYAAGALRSRAREDAVVDQAPVPIVVTDAEGRVTKVNASAEYLFAPAAGGPCTETLRLVRDGKAMACGGPCPLVGTSAAVEVTHERADGSTVPLLATVAAVPADSGGSAYVHTFQDITRLKLADEAKSLFLATATHELKTPLTVIRGFLETIAKPDVDPQLLGTATEIMRSRADELSAIIERVLLASRIEAGHVTVETRPVNVVEVVRDRVDAFAAATRRIIALTTTDEAVARTDGPTLATIVDHLLENAAKYSEPATPIDVTITAAPDQVTVRVSDRGVGMSADELARCFERFWQADPTSRRTVGGTGIGLYIVRSLTESMGGRVSAESKLGAGTTFTVELASVSMSLVGDGGAESARPEPATGDPSIVREFMRQIGVGERRPS